LWGINTNTYRGREIHKKLSRFAENKAPIPDQNDLVFSQNLELNCSFVFYPCRELADAD
jgi:hypothetical protein